MKNLPSHPLSDAFRAAGQVIGASSAAPDERPDRAGKRLIAGHFDASVARQLKMLAVERDTTVQKLLGEALRLLFAEHGIPFEPRPPAHRARKRRGPISR